MNYSLEPWVKEKLRELPLLKRIRVRWMLHRALTDASYWDNKIAEIENRMDCGYDLADYITGGKLSRFAEKRAHHLRKADAIIQSLND